jgi:uncharacterized coiled-coil protein SlyX
MVRILLPIVLILIVICVGFLLLFRPSWFPFFRSTPQTIQVIPANYTPEQRAELIQQLITDLNKQLADERKNMTPTTVVASNSASMSQEERIKSLEAAIANLKSQVDKLSQAKSTPLANNTSFVKVTPSPSTTTKNPPVYIPLGVNGQAGDQDYYTLDTFEVTIDSGDYKGYKNAQLEVDMKLSEQAGTGYSRLLNATDNTPVSSSDVSTTSDKFNWQSSGAFQLGSGRKTYRLQVKNTDGKVLFVESARLKISY